MAVIGIRPGLACEVMPEGVVAARGSGSRNSENGGTLAETAVSQLPAGAVGLGLIGAWAQHAVESAAAARIEGGASPSQVRMPLLRDRGAVVKALESALDSVAEKVKERAPQVTLIVPDAAVRVLLLDFDTLPQKEAEILGLLRFRLKKLVPFEVETAAVAYQVISGTPGKKTTGKGNAPVKAMVAVMPREIREEYEAVVREAGYQPGALLPSTLAALAAVPAEGAWLLINASELSVTTAIVNAGQLLLHRSVEIEHTPEAGREVRPGEQAAWTEEDAAAEILHTVSVAVAYFEDTLGRAPDVVLVAGAEGAEGLRERLALGEALMGDEPGNESALRSLNLRDLVTSANLIAETAGRVPHGMLAGVLGALEN